MNLQSIIYDVFPADANFAAANHLSDVSELSVSLTPRDHQIAVVSEARIFVTDVLIVVVMDTPTGAQVVFQEQYETLLPPDASKVYRIVTKSGKMVAFKKNTSCACGSRLRALNPYKVLTSQKGVK